MAKKKKTQLKPVARGFATTSQPKKVVIVEDDGSTSGIAERASTPDSSKISDGNGAGEPKTKDESDPGKSEENLLQGIVEKLQDKTEKEVLRTVKTIEAERRFSQSHPRLELSSTLRDTILRLVIESESVEASKPIDEPEEKVLARLGLAYGVLRRLGFSEDRVDECLHSIHGVELEEAYEWLLLHCGEAELKWKNEPDSGDSRPPRTIKAPQPSSASRTPAQFLASPSPTPPKPTSKLDANARTFIPSSQLSHSSASKHIVSAGKAIIKSRILSSVGRSASPSESDFDSSDPEDPNAEYVRLKMRLTDITSRRGQHENSSTSPVIQELQARLKVVMQSYFFDERDAERQYQVERDRADAALLQARLRGSPDSSSDTLPSTPPLVQKSRSARPPKTASPLAKPDIFDEDSEDSGGILAGLDEMSTTEVSEQGTTISIRSMALPKHWSGRTPKKLLAETVARTDRYAVITYRIISGSSRAKRAAVSIREKEWMMENVACVDETQAEHYAATLALHALTFPPAEHFVTGMSNLTGGQTFFRLLPAVYRDLWDELEEARKLREASINREVWAKLRKIVEPKLETQSKLDSKGSKPTIDSKGTFPSRPSTSLADLAPEQIMAGFHARKSSAAYQEMMYHRNQLPIAQYRNEIISALELSQVLLLTGETGCGKSTQVPTFILEDQLSKGKPCKIFCTEPRRISAISLAQRVSRELGDAPGAVGTMSSLVGYSIRLESNTSRNTRLTFVTNGIALRMLEGGSGQGGQGTAFDEITHIIIDEVHERSIESDFLLIVLKSLREQRPDLKVILMSATADAGKISDFFGGCPTLHVPGRTFPVDVRYLEDAVEFTKWTISENSPYARRLHDRFYSGKNRADWSEETAHAVEDDEDEQVQENIALEKRYSPSTAATINLLDERLITYDLIMRLLERICFEGPDHTSYSAAILIFMPGIGEIRRLHDMLLEHSRFGAEEEFKLYPLHSTVSSEGQSAVFDIPPSYMRKIVIATNIAETGITIPDITCVIDTGKHREMRFDEKRQLSRLAETFIAKSNAAQRRGRAGRVRPGLCFHLFTKLRNDTLMADHPLPEMMRLSLSDLALRIKIMKVKLGSSIEDVLSRAMDPPSSINVQRAISMLVEVRALTPTEEITPMGRLLSKLPTDVHLGKFLLTATLFRCLDPALTIAASLNSKSPFISPFGLEQESDRAKRSFRIEDSDFLTIHNAFASWRRASANPGFARKFCRVNFLSHQNLQQIEELRQQFLGYLVDSSFIHVDKAFVRELSRARYGRNRTRFVTVPAELDRNSGNTALLNAALVAGLYPKVLSIDATNGQNCTISNNQLVSFHPSSINFGRKAAEFGVNYLSYFTLMHSKKLYAWETGPVDDMSLLLLCGEADFKPISDTASIDRNKIRFQIDPKSNVALKHLRTQLGSLLAQQYRGKPLVESQVLWNDLAMTVLGKVKLEELDDEQRPIGVIS